jgi:hypothetical protein
MNEATIAYQNRRKEIDEVLAKIQVGLTDLDAGQKTHPEYWTYSGDASRVLEHLVTAAHALGVIDSNEARSLTGIEY